MHSESTTCVEEATDGERARADGVVIINRVFWRLQFEGAVVPKDMVLVRMEDVRTDVVTSGRVSRFRRP